MVTSRAASLGTFPRLPRITTVLHERGAFSHTISPSWKRNSGIPCEIRFCDLPDEDFRRLHWKDPTKSCDDDDDDDETTMDTDSEEEPDEHVVAPFIPTTPTTPQQKPITYDEIVVEQPSLDSIVSIIFGPLADSIPGSFKDALSRPDRKF
jgi:hypothetical protein